MMRVAGRLRESNRWAWKKICTSRSTPTYTILQIRRYVLAPIAVTTAIIIGALCTYTLTTPITRIPRAFSTLTRIRRLTILQIRRCASALYSWVAVNRASATSMGMARVNLLAWTALASLGQWLLELPKPQQQAYRGRRASLLMICCNILEGVDFAGKYRFS